MRITSLCKISAIRWMGKLWTPPKAKRLERASQKSQISHHRGDLNLPAKRVRIWASLSERSQEVAQAIEMPKPIEILMATPRVLEATRKRHPFHPNGLKTKSRGSWWARIKDLQMHLILRQAVRESLREAREVARTPTSLPINRTTVVR